MENDPINQRLRAINLCKELIAAAEQLLTWQPYCSKGSSGDLRQKRLRAAIDNLDRADLRESTSPPQDSTHNLEWVKDCARELVERNADRGRSYDNSPDYLETAAAIQRHYLLWAEAEAPKSETSLSGMNETELANIEVRDASPRTQESGRESFRQAAQAYLREWSTNYRTHAALARMEWSGSQAEYNLANFASQQAELRESEAPRDEVEHFARQNMEWAKCAESWRETVRIARGLLQRVTEPMDAEMRRNWEKDAGNFLAKCPYCGKPNNECMATCGQGARESEAPRQPKIYKYPEAPQSCPECDSTCFVTAGGMNLVCYHCHLVNEIGKLEALRQPSLEP